MKLDDNKLRCFAINNFGDGQHPFAENDNLNLFKSDYVRQCLSKCADDVRVNEHARTRADELAKL